MVETTNQILTFIFPYIGSFIIPTDEHIYFKMVIAPPTRSFFESFETQRWM
jgi:hypothetical protein